MSDSSKRAFAEQINRINKIVVLNLIRRMGEISRADIVKKTDLSAPTVTRIVDSLINKEGLAVQVGVGESSGGRPPLIVRFNGKENYVIGIDWGRTHIHGIVANLNADTILNQDIMVSTEGIFENDLPKLLDLISQLISNSKVNPDKIMGIGLAVAGFVNKKTGRIENSPNFGWENINIKDKVASKFHIPVIIENVSRAMAIGELWFGLGNKIKDFVFANIGYGIGSGIILDGQPYHGFDGYSGEIGHTRISSTQINGKSRQCACGKYDCIENYASGRGILQTVINTLNEHPDSMLIELCNNKPENISTKMIAEAANNGDLFARSVMIEAAAMLGITFASLANIINPEAIIIGGKVAKSGEFFIRALEESFKKETLPHISREIKILRSQLNDEAAVKGAIALILKEVLELNVKL